MTCNAPHPHAHGVRCDQPAGHRGCHEVVSPEPGVKADQRWWGPGEWARTPAAREWTKR